MWEVREEEYAMKTLLLVLGGNPERERRCFAACAMLQPRINVGAVPRHRKGNQAMWKEDGNGDLVEDWGSGDSGGGAAHRKTAEWKWPIWLSGPSLVDDCLDTCAVEGIDLRWLLVDYHALDTLSNFTTLLEEMRAHGFEEVRIASSERHIARAEAIAEVVLPAAGLRMGASIVVQPSKGERFESEALVARDVLRAWLWRMIGVDITFPLIWLFHRERIRQRNRRVQDYNYRGCCCYD